MGFIIGHLRSKHERIIEWKSVPLTIFQVSMTHNKGPQEHDYNLLSLKMMSVGRIKWRRWSRLNGNTRHFSKGNPPQGNVAV